MKEDLFAVVYRFYIKPTKENQYLKSWKIVSRFFTQNRGALSSTLHKTESGYWLAYSKWPNKKTRDASWQSEGVEVTLPQNIQDEIHLMKGCLDLKKEEFPEICMDVIEES